MTKDKAGQFKILNLIIKHGISERSRASLDQCALCLEQASSTGTTYTHQAMY